MKSKRTKVPSSVRDKKLLQTGSEKSVIPNPQAKVTMELKSKHTDNLLSFPLFNEPLQLAANNDALEFLRNGPVRVGQKVRSEEEKGNLVKEEVKGKVKHFAEMVKPRKPTPLSKDRKPSAPVSQGVQKRQRPSTAQNPKSAIAGIYGKAPPRESVRQEMRREELMARSAKQPGTSIRGVVASKPKWKN